MASIHSTRHLLLTLLAQQQLRLPLPQKLAVPQAVPMASAEASSAGDIGGLSEPALVETALCPLAKDGDIGQPLTTLSLLLHVWAVLVFRAPTVPL